MMTLKQTISVFFVLFALVGCGTGPQAIDMEASKKATDSAVRVRAIYDAASGDYDKVPDSDKKFLVERFSSDKQAREAFEKIKHPPGGMPGGPPVNQPN